MIDWRIVLGAFGGGLALTFWLESQYRLLQSQKRLTRRLQAAAVLTALLAVSLLTFAYLHPPGLYSAPRGVQVQAAVLTTTRFAPPSLAPPSVFVMATPTQPVGDTPAPLTNAPAESAAVETAYLHIPTLNVSRPIIELPLQNGRWDVSSLGEQVGRLGGTGRYPGDTLAPVFAGHMTFPASATLETGAFANLQYAIYGTEVIYEVNGQETVYTVTEINRVAPAEAKRLYLADGNSILLVTCTDWDPDGRIYTNRLLVRAVRKD